MENQIDAMTVYSRTITLYEVQRSYQAACGNRKDNHRNIRLQDMALRVAGFEDSGGQLTKELPNLTRKEGEFLAIFQTGMTR